MRPRPGELAATTRRARVRRFRQEVENRRWRRQAIHAAECCGISLFVLAMLRSCTLDPPVGTLSFVEPHYEWRVPFEIFALFIGLGLLAHLVGWYGPRAPEVRRPSAGDGEHPGG